MRNISVMNGLTTVKCVVFCTSYNDFVPDTFHYIFLGNGLQENDAYYVADIIRVSLGVNP